jgi:hypothetical protein
MLQLLLLPAVATDACPPGPLLLLLPLLFLQLLLKLTNNCTRDACKHRTQQCSQYNGRIRSKCNLKRHS